MTRLSAGLFLASALALPALAADPPPKADPPAKGPFKGGPKGFTKGGPTRPLPPNAMPLTGLAPSKVVPDLCLYRYHVSTTSAACQEFCDQGFGYYYSYVWIEAARCFETALKHDPDCAYAWLGLHRALEKWGKGTAAPSASPYHAAVGGLVYAKLPDRVGKTAAEFALEKARQLMPKANHREQLIIQARLQEKGMWPNTQAEDRKKKAQQSLDELLTLYEDDQEGWYWRAQIADGPNAAPPIYKALLQINPVHPGANHELVHFYENFKRPALGWPFAEGYIKSSPGLPHAFHMQAHLAMRIGKWQQTTDWSWKAVELEKAYHKFLDVRPGEDHQFSHHMETLTRSLVHDGRFAEARDIKQQAQGYGYNFRPEWFRMALAEKDWNEALKTVEFYRKSDKANGAYHAAAMYLEKGDTARAGAEVDTLRQLQQAKKTDKPLEMKLLEVQGRHLCQTGQGEAGLKMLKKAVDATKNDYRHHAWGNGAVLMEAWGVGALECGNAVAAEEAFQEALAHDAGSVRGALGMWAVCERLGRTEEAERFLKVARKCWAKADSKHFEALRADMQTRAAKVDRPSISAAAAGQE